jgi:hypothetical protein
LLLLLTSNPQFRRLLNTVDLMGKLTVGEGNNSDGSKNFYFLLPEILNFQSHHFMLLCKKASLFLKRHDQYSFIKYRVHSNL